MPKRIFGNPPSDASYEPDLIARARASGPAPAPRTCRLLRTHAPCLLARASRRVRAWQRLIRMASLALDNHFVALVRAALCKALGGAAEDVEEDGKPVTRIVRDGTILVEIHRCLLYTSPSPRDS